MTASSNTPAPDGIVDIAVGYMAAKQLFAASRIGLFAALADRPLGPAELAERTGVTPRVARILADAMASRGLLVRAEGCYGLSPAAATYLVGSGSRLDLAPFLAFLNEVSYPHWVGFDATVDSSEPGHLDLGGSRRDTFLAGVMTYNALHAAMLADGFDFGPYRELLDLGGLSGAFSIEAMRRNERLRTTFVFDPGSVDRVVREATEAGFGQRVTGIGAVTDTAEPPRGGFDLVMANHVVHRFSEEQNAGILARARAASAPGARLVLLDFFLDDDERQRPLDALHAAEYLVIDGTVVYPESEVRGWLAGAGWTVDGRLALPGSPRALLATAG
ncbi:methyltransferase family protein [Pseudonocardia acaciae]|uniref:methyltransferase family protein n=1 Tax=Pseudonocardia acaciae TaxID=551276 RepID=UPI00048CC2A4|nr:methyltransferase dimerization domain-containing protein [Pseudonocardia acaciae]